MRQNLLKFSWIILPLLLIALTTLTLLFDIGAGREAVQQFAGEQEDLLHSAVYGITEAFNDLSNSISVLAHPEVARGPAELRAAMAAVYEHSQLRGSKSFLHIAFYDETGGAAIVYPPGSTAPALPSDNRSPAQSDGVSVSLAPTQDQACIVTVSIPVRSTVIGGRIVGYLDLTRALSSGRDEGGYLSGIIRSGATCYVLDGSGVILQGPEEARGFARGVARFAGGVARFARFARLNPRLSSLAGPARAPGSRGLRGLGGIAEAEDPRSALVSIFVNNGYGGLFRMTLADTHREAVGVLRPFELGGHRLELLSLKDSDAVIAPAKSAQRRYSFALAGFFLLLMAGGVLYWRHNIIRLKKEREETDLEARELEMVGLTSIREISQAITRELELSQLLDLLCGKISEALGLAGLQVLAPAEGLAKGREVSYHLLASHFSDELKRALGRRRGGGGEGAKPLGNPLFPGESLQRVMDDVVERMRTTGRSLRLGHETGRTESRPGKPSEASYAPGKTAPEGKIREAGEDGGSTQTPSDLKPLWDDALKSARGVGIAELVISPLESKDHFEGVAVFLPSRGGIPLELYETFAANLAQAIQGARSIEHQKKTLEELDQAYGRLRAFSRIGAEIVLQKNFYKIGQTIVDAITTHSTFSRAVLSLVEGDEMRRVAFSNLTQEEREDLQQRRPFSQEDLERIKTNARKISHSYYLPAALVRGTIGEQGLISTRTREEFIDWDPNDFFFVPLDGPMGMLGVIFAPTEATIQPLESFAHLAAQAITTSKLRWELERSQNDYRNLFREATDALFVLDEDQKVVASNRQFSTLAGEPGEDFIGTSFLDLVMPDWRAAVKRAFERVRSGLGRQDLEFHLQSRSGPSRTVAMSVEAKAFPRNVTGADLGFSSIVDGDTGEARPTLREVMDPKTDLDLATDGGYIRYQGSLRDITAAKEAERELMRRQEQLKIINTLGRLALSSFDLEPLFRKTVNAIHQSLGYDNVSLFMQDAETDELVLEAQSGIFDVLVGRGYRVPVTEGVVGWTARSGVTRYVPDTSKDPHYIMPAGIFEIGAELAIPLLVEGEVKGVLDLETTQTEAFDPADISALETVADQLSQAIHNINLYQELRERALALALANEELLKVDKMKSDFVSMVSHELNTPVTVIKGYAQLMAGRVIGEVNEKQQDILETIIEKADHLSRLIIELLDLLKIETGQYTPEFSTFNLTKLLEELFVEQSKYLDIPRMSLVLELPKQPIILDVDLAKIRTVFIHLLSNANKFTIGEGTVTISCEEAEDLYRFTVADTGIGIPEVEYGRIFERLYQVDSTLTRHYGGTGLGLAVTRAIIERHNGRIWVESELGEGSRFIFTLPRDTGSPVIPA
ncbi:MAG: ATP-binding protein [bacterium]|nr:ATP-binding protein [bacterium]